MPTFGEHARDALFAARLKLPAGEKLTPEAVAAVIDSCYRAHCAAHKRPYHPQVKDGPADPCFDALAAAEGSNPAELTPTASRRIAVALAGIRRAKPDITPEEITRRAVRYREMFPRTVCTANAIEANFPRLNCFKFKAPAPVAPLPIAQPDERTPSFDCFRKAGFEV